jgi:all-trans-8'-apo-beta-carotenal 15,15'-oxygenase
MDIGLNCSVAPDSETPLRSSDMLRVIGEASRTVTEEFTDQPLRVDGELPAPINGVLFRNGPGRFERGNQRYAHPFDGDGHIMRFDIGAQGIRYSNRFVRTREFIAEEGSGRMLYRAFGTNLPGGLAANLLRLNFKNAANTNVVWHGGRLLALWEGGPPHRLDPHTLATLGSEDFDGQLRNASPPPARWLAPLLPFSAHPRIDAVSGELFNFGLVSGRPNRLLLYHIERNGRMAPWQAHELPRFSFIHDFAVTRRWFCFLLPHADFDLTRATLGLTTAVGSLRLDSERPMQAMLIPRDGSSAGPRPIDCGSGFVFHIAHAFDRDDGALVLDVVRYGRYPDFGSFEALFTDDDPRIWRAWSAWWSIPRAGAATSCPGAQQPPSYRPRPQARLASCHHPSFGAHGS